VHRRRRGPDPALHCGTNTWGPVGSARWACSRSRLRDLAWWTQMLSGRGPWRALEVDAPGRCQAVRQDSNKEASGLRPTGTDIQGGLWPPSHWELSI